MNQGAGMVLSLENSVPKNRRADFPYLFSLALAIITTLYVTFGALGYASFGKRDGHFLSSTPFVSSSV